MLLDPRLTGIKISIIFFFLIGLLGWLKGISAYTCCKRSLMGAVVVYLISMLAIKIINTILIDAMYKSGIKKNNHSNQGTD